MVRLIEEVSFSGPSLVCLNVDIRQVPYTDVGLPERPYWKQYKNEQNLKL